MYRRLLTLVIAILICSGGFAQSPNSFSIALDKKVTKLHGVSCGENGLCLVTEKKGKQSNQLCIKHIDTIMRMQFDTSMTLASDLKPLNCFYEDGITVVFCQWFQKSRRTDKGLLLFYRPTDNRLDTVTVYGLPNDAVITHLHYHQGSLFFTTKSQYGDRVWYLPSGTIRPTPFLFTQENPGQVLTTAVDTAQHKAVICFTSGGRTMYFETDFHGQSSFANILNEPATYAQWLPVGRNHSVLMLYYQDDETFYIHPVNILNHKVIPFDTLYCADIGVPSNLPASAKGKRTIIITPHTYVNFLPSHTQVNENRISCITELYYPEYYNYFNGWYVEPRFNGYRFERADVHLFDTNGVFLTNVIFPYDESASLHQNISKNLNIYSLQNSNLLLYQHYAQELTTMLLDSDGKVKDPQRTNTLPLPKVPFKKQSIVVDRIEPWYGHNQFLLSCFRIKILSQRKVGYEIRKIEYH